MITPWGDAATMRERRLAPGPGGPQGRTPEQVKENQRRRLYAGTVAAVAANGYSGSPVADICHISAVSRADFYRLFDSREDCFLTTAGELHRLAMERIVAAEERQEDWEEGVRAAIEELLALLVEQPAAARLSIVDVYEAPGGRAWARAGLRELEELLGRCFAASPGRAGLPHEIVAALVAGVQMVIHRRLHRGEEERLPALGPALADWVLSYTTPPRPLPAAPPARHPLPPAAHEEAEMSERLLRAIAEVCAGEGASGLRPQTIVARARTSLRSLYERYPNGAGEAFLAAFEEIAGRCVAISRGAYETADDWAAQMDAVNRELFDYLASEPAFATTVLVEVLGAGPDALALRDRVLTPFEELFAAGEALAPAVPEVCREAIVGAVYALVGREIEERGAAGVPGLVPTATYMELAPYLGVERAAAAARRFAERATPPGLEGPPREAPARPAPR